MSFTNVLSQLIDKTIQVNGQQHFYRVVYPANIDSNKNYPVVLALSGGNASLEISNYCFANMFSSAYFESYITILPYSPHTLFRDWSEDEINSYLDAIIENEKVTAQGWIVLGTSNGGVAAFNFPRVRPQLFQGIITMPGVLSLKILQQVPEHEWEKYKIVIAVGEHDDNHWKSSAEKTATQLKDKVKKIVVFEMKGQGHIVAQGYNVDEVYKLFFE